VPTPEGTAASAVQTPTAIRCADRLTGRCAARPSAGALGAAPESSAAKVHVVTDVLDLDISLRGGEIDRADLSQYPLHKDTPNVPVRLENDDPASLYLVQTGLTGAPDEAAPSHLATFTAAQTSYTLPAGAGELSVPLSWTDGHGLTVTKTFVFKRGQYRIDLLYDAHNDSSAPRSLASYAQILRHWEHASRSYFDVETYSFKGPAVFDGTKSHDLKVESEPDSKFSETITNGWLASLQHHFVSAIVPPESRPITIGCRSRIISTS
jgi:YidC/Oxa1 family membrane protein insertase